MSACKTGCPSRNDTNGPLCSWCADAWHTSKERKRYDFYIHNVRAANAALVDFCNRVRAERRPEVPHAP